MIPVFTRIDEDSFMSDARRRRRGFTLIEVLVVVAIIALLVAILLPSLNRAREATRAALCGTHIKEALTGTLLHYHETGMRRETWSTNFGWAVFSLKVGKGQPDYFKCPSDQDPLPIPAVFHRLYDPDTYRGMTTSDAIFNRVRHLSSGQWELDVQDQLHGASFGGDAWNDGATDVNLKYFATIGQYATQAEARSGAVAWRHEVYSFRGEHLWTAGQNGGADTGGQKNVTLMWMSYGANASAGLDDVKGNPILVAEARKLGLFPEKLGNYQADYLQRALRLRHGSRPDPTGLLGVDYAQDVPLAQLVPGANAPQIGNRRDGNYEPRSRLNAGFFDGHVESLTYQQMFTNFDPVAAQTQRAVPKGSMWIGTRRGAPSF
jgi:prepilin-type N-terminal cleavage/methylation domain-containing protein/prepilin-type processing-associated H-X9-DG protein